MYKHISFNSLISSATAKHLMCDKMKETSLQIGNLASNKVDGNN